MLLRSRIVDNRSGQSLLIGVGAIFIFSLIIAELLRFRVDHKIFSTARKLATRLAVERSIRYGISCATTTLPANLPAGICNGVNRVNIRRWEPYTRVNAILPQPGGTGFYIGGDFTRFNGISGVNRLVRLQANGSVDAGFNTGTGFNGAVRAIASAGATNQIYVGGEFTQYQGRAANYLVRLNPDGSRDPAFNNSGAGVVLRIASVPGLVPQEVITATFDPLLPLITVTTIPPILPPPSRTGSQVYRLGNTGAVANAVATDGAVLAILPLASGEIVFGGSFTSFGGTAANRIVRRSSSLGHVSSYGAGANQPVFALAAATDASGDFFAGGAFTSYQGTGVAPVIRLQAGGARVGTFPFPASPSIAHEHHPARTYPPSVFALSTFSPAVNQHRLFVAGNFARGLHYFDVSPPPPANPVAVPITSPAPDYPVHAVVPQGASGALMGGEFLTAAGTPSNRLIALTATGTLDPSFNPGTAFDDQIMIGANGTRIGYQPPFFEMEATCTQTGGITTFNVSSPDPEDPMNKRIVFFKDRPLTCPE